MWIVLLTFTCLRPRAPLRFSRRSERDEFIVRDVFYTIYLLFKSRLFKRIHTASIDVSTIWRGFFFFFFLFFISTARLSRDHSENKGVPTTFAVGQVVTVVGGIRRMKSKRRTKKETLVNTLDSWAVASSSCQAAACYGPTDR